MEKEAGRRAVRKGRVCECCPSYAASAGDDGHAACVVLNPAGKRPESRRFSCAVVKPESHFRNVYKLMAKTYGRKFFAFRTLTGGSIHAERKKNRVAHCRFLWRRHPRK